jgi:hypothetical protein
LPKKHQCPPEFDYKSLQLSPTQSLTISPGQRPQKHVFNPYLSRTTSMKLFFNPGWHVCALTLLALNSSAFADINSDTEALLNWAEQTYPQIFPSHKATKTLGEWIYREYSEVGIYAGVNKSDNSVYVLGGAFGNQPTVVGSLAALMTIVNAGGSWNPDAIISSSGAGAPKIVMDSAGNGIALWVQDVGGASTDDLMFARYVAGSGWTLAAPLENDNDGTVQSTEFNIAVDKPTGRAIATWHQFTSASKFDLWARIYTPGNGWGQATRIESADETMGFSRAGIDPNGNAIVAWSQANLGGRYSVYANRFAVGSGWGSRELLENNNVVGGGDGDARIAVLPNGNAVVAWKSNPGIAGSGTDIWTNSYTVSGGWGTAAELVSDNSRDLEFGNLEIIPYNNGDVLLAWGQLNFLNSAFQYTVQTKRKTAGNWQSASTPVAPMTSTSKALNSVFTLANNSSGATVVSWALDDYSVQASVAPAGAAFAAPVAIKAPGPLEVLSVPAVDIDNAGNAVATWQQRGTNQVRNIWLARFSAGSGWQAGEILAADTWAQPAVAVSGNGNALLTWTRFTDQGTIAHARHFKKSP